MDIQELNNDQIYDLVKELLPQLEQDIRKEVEQQMSEEYQQRLEHAAEEIQKNALNELDAIFMEISTETQKQFIEKNKELDEQEKQLEDQFQNLEVIVRDEIELKVKSTFEEEKKVLVQTIIEEINKQGFNEDIEIRIKDKLRQEYEEEIKKEMQKKEKQMKVNLSKKLEAEKKQLEEFYKMEIKAKIDKEKSLLMKEKSELARLKSLKNIKVNKLEEEKNKIKEQLQDQEKKYSIIVENLQNQIKETTIQIERYKKDMNIKGILKNSQVNFNQSQQNQQQNEQQSAINGSFHNNQMNGDGARSKSPNNQFNSQVNKENSYVLNRKNSNSSGIGINQSQPNMIEQPDDLEFQKKYLNNPSKNPFLLSQTQNNLFEYQTGQIIQEQNQSAAFQQQLDNKNNIEDILNTFDPLSPPPSTYQKKIQGFADSGSKSVSSGMHLIGQPKSSLEIYNEYQKKQQENAIQLNNNNHIQNQSSVEQEGISANINRSKDYSIRDKAGSQTNQQMAYDNQSSLNRGLALGDSFCRKTEGESIKDKMMKQKKQNLELNIQQNEQQYDKYIAIESYLQQQFIEKLRSTYNQKENITELIQNLIDAWNYRNISYTERIQFIGSLEYFQQDFDGIYVTLNTHYENLHNDILISQRIIEKMNTRENILISQQQQQQISAGQTVDPDQFALSQRLSARKVNSEIKKIDFEIISLIDEFQTIYKKAFTWQGFLLKDLIEVELWEENQQMQNMQDIKSQILEKLQNKFN